MDTGEIEYNQSIINDLALPGAAIMFQLVQIRQRRENPFLGVGGYRNLSSNFFFPKSPSFPDRYMKNKIRIESILYFIWLFQKSIHFPSFILTEYLNFIIKILISFYFHFFFKCREPELWASSDSLIILQPKELNPYVVHPY